MLVPVSLLILCGLAIVIVSVFFEGRPCRKEWWLQQAAKWRADADRRQRWFLIVLTVVALASIIAFVFSLYYTR